MSTKYNKAMCKQVVEMMSNGSSKKATAAKLEISLRTFYTYIEKHKAFRDAVEAGHQACYSYWEDLGKRLSQDGSASVYALMMANMFGWRSSRTELSGSEKEPLRIEIVEVGALPTPQVGDLLDL